MLNPFRGMCKRKAYWLRVKVAYLEFLEYISIGPYGPLENEYNRRREVVEEEIRRIEGR